MSIIRTHFVYQVTNLAYANTFVYNLNQNLWFRDRCCELCSSVTIQMAAILFMNVPVYYIIYM